MKLNEKIASFLLILFISSLFVCLPASGQSKPSRQSSMEAFSKGNYEQAYREFRELLLTYPKDPLYKYYSAVSLVNLRKDPAEAETLLNQSLNSPASIKSLPEDALYYLGRARHLQGKFNDAIDSYSTFAAQAGKKKAKEFNISDLIQQCKVKEGKIVEIAVRQPDEQVAVVQKIPEKTIQRENLPPEADKDLDEALEMQIKADSLAALAMKKQFPATGTSEGELQNRNSAEKKDSGQIVAEMQTESRNQVKEKAITEVIKDTFVLTPVEKPAKENITDIPRPEVVKKTPDSIKHGTGIFSVFEILPKPVTDPAQKIGINPEIPEGIIYRIQMAVFKNPVSPSYFKGITPIFGFKGANATAATYYAGMFRRQADATKALTAVKSKGFKDSFIVAFMSGKPVSSDRAAVLEKEWKDKPFFSLQEVQPAELDTIPPTLVFRVEVAKSPKPLKDENVEEFRRLAGKRGLDILTAPDGNSVYLIGNFITFESADDYAGIVARNGYRDAKVVAWLGKKEIDLETAKLLFENLK
jgi:hypothetical protein